MTHDITPRSVSALSLNTDDSVAKAGRLDHALTTLQQRWGSGVVRLPRIEPDRMTAHISTGFCRLDAALCIDGIPRGAITQLVGIPTSGMTTLALKTVAQAQGDGDMAVIFDLNRTFDPEYAAKCGVRLTQLLLVRADRGNVLDIAHSIIVNRGAGVMVLDMTDPASLSAIPREGIVQLTRELAVSPCALIVLTTPQTALYLEDRSHQIALRLSIQRQGWLKRRGNVQGWRSAVTILKSRYAPSGRRVQITIGNRSTLNGGQP